MTTLPPGAEATTGEPHTPAEAYCSTCGRSYAPDVDRCPEDDTRLVKFAAQRDPLVGRTLDGRFEVRQPLGKGGMGTVYRALQLSVDREVAIKVVHPRLSNDRQAAKRFLREARLASRLNQPGVVHVIDFGQTDDGVLYLVMELLRGRTLASELGGERRFSVRRALTIGLQLCDALEAAHAQGIVHRDLKPGNVVVLDDPPGRDLIKVLDFGLAKSLVHDTSQVTNTDAILGTPLYMSPEQVQGKPSDQRGDLYSLGCILFELLTGAPPFVDESVNLILARHLSEPPPPLPPHVPARLRSLVEQLLAKDPDQRVQTAGEVRAAMQWVLDSGALAGAGAQEPAASDTVPDVELQHAVTADVDRPVAGPGASGRSAVPPGASSTMAAVAAASSESAVVDGERRRSARRALAILAVTVLAALVVVVFALARSRDRGERRAVAAGLGADGGPTAAEDAPPPRDAGVADAPSLLAPIDAPAARDADLLPPPDALPVYDAGRAPPRPRLDASTIGPRPARADAGARPPAPIDAARPPPRPIDAGAVPFYRPGEP